MPGLLTLFTSDITKQEIAEAQRALHLRKKLVHARHRMLYTHTKQSLASKKALIAAVSAGFVVGQVSKSGRCQHCDANGQNQQTQKEPLDFSDLLRRGLKIYSLVQTASSLTGFLQPD